MRRAQLQLLLIFLFAARFAPGQTVTQSPQNSEIIVMAGPVTGSAEVTTTSAQASGKVSWQIDFAHTLHSYSFGDLWWEFPLTFVLRGDAYAGGRVSANSNNSTFSTPGVRLQVPMGSRMAFYAVGGVGLAIFSYDQVSVSAGIKVQSLTNYHGVVDFGGGADFRLTRLLSLRGEVRDFVTGKGLGGAPGRNQVLADFGVVFHF